MAEADEPEAVALDDFVFFLWQDLDGLTDGDPPSVVVIVMVTTTTSTVTVGEAVGTDDADGTNVVVDTIVDPTPVPVGMEVELSSRDGTGMELRNEPPPTFTGGRVDAAARVVLRVMPEDVGVGVGAAELGFALPLPLPLPPPMAPKEVTKGGPG